MFMEKAGIKRYLRDLWLNILGDKEKERSDQLLKTSKQAEFLALQNQINPHFLYNVLDSIRGDALKAGVTNIADITEALSVYFRYSITETDLLVSMLEELDNADNYFKIQKYRFGEKLQMELDLGSFDHDLSELKCPKLMLQPIIENAIFHGIEKKVDGGIIHLKIRGFSHKVEIWIHDNGVGMTIDELDLLNSKLKRDLREPEIDGKHGIAMYNVCRRIKLLFGEEYGINVYSISGWGTDVCITLPMNQDK